MPKINLKKIGTGLLLIAIALAATLGAFYFLEVQPELTKREKERKSRLNAQKAKIDERVQALKKEEASKTFNMDLLLKEAQAIYGDKEKDRKEGYLWIDRKGAQCIITLGALNGLNTGSLVSVYDGNRKIGQVAVDNPMDVISYGHLVDRTMEQLNSDYYRIVKE